MQSSSLLQSKSSNAVLRRFRLVVIDRGTARLGLDLDLADGNRGDNDRRADVSVVSKLVNAGKGRAAREGVLLDVHGDGAERQRLRLGQQRQHAAVQPDLGLGRLVDKAGVVKAGLADARADRLEPRGAEVARLELAVHVGVLQAALHTVAGKHLAVLGASAEALGERQDLRKQGGNRARARASVGDTTK